MASAPIEMSTNVVSSAGMIQWRLDNLHMLSDQPASDGRHDIKSPIFDAAGHKWTLSFTPCYVPDTGNNKGQTCCRVMLHLAAAESKDVTAYVEFVMRGGGTNDGDEKDSVSTRRRLTSSDLYGARGTRGYGVISLRTSVFTIIERHHVLICESHISVIQPTHNVPPIPISHLPALSNDFAKLLADKSTSDVVFKIHDKSLTAHRAILCVRSNVFKRMFSSDMMESKTNEVIVDDIDPETFKQLLKFVYTGACDQLSDNIPTMKDDKQKTSSVVASILTSWTLCKSRRRTEDKTVSDASVLAISLMIAAHRYELHGLVDLCSGVLARSLSVDNIIAFASLAELYNATHLKKACLGFITMNRAGMRELANY